MITRTRHPLRQLPDPGTRIGDRDLFSNTHPTFVQQMYRSVIFVRLPNPHFTLPPAVLAPVFAEIPVRRNPAPARSDNAATST
jgi:hypothetical protein